MDCHFPICVSSCDDTWYIWIWLTIIKTQVGAKYWSYLVTIFHYPTWSIGYRKEMWSADITLRNAGLLYNRIRKTIWFRCVRCVQQHFLAIPLHGNIKAKQKKHVLYPLMQWKPDVFRLYVYISISVYISIYTYMCVCVCLDHSSGGIYRTQYSHEIQHLRLGSQPPPCNIVWKFGSGRSKMQCNLRDNSKVRICGMRSMNYAFFWIIFQI